MFRGRHEKGMYYFFQVLLKVFFKIYYLAGVISLWLCNLFVCKKKSYEIYRSFKRSYIETYFTIIKIRFKFRCLFSFLIYSKLSNMLRILATDALQIFRPMKQTSVLFGSPRAMQWKWDGNRLHGLPMFFVQLCILNANVNS
jgi:hypothetical protein